MQGYCWRTASSGGSGAEALENKGLVGRLRLPTSLHRALVENERRRREFASSIMQGRERGVQTA